MDKYTRMNVNIKQKYILKKFIHMEKNIIPLEIWYMDIEYDIYIFVEYNSFTLKKVIK